VYELAQGVGIVWGHSMGEGPWYAGHSMGGLPTSPARLVFTLRASPRHIPSHGVEQPHVPLLLFFFLYKILKERKKEESRRLAAGKERDQFRDRFSSRHAGTEAAERPRDGGALGAGPMARSWLARWHCPEGVALGFRNLDPAADIREADCLSEHQVFNREASMLNQHNQMC